MPELSATIARLLEKDRAARYGTAADLKVELVRLKRQLESGPTHADAVVAAGPTRSRRSRVATVTALLAVAVIATWGLFKVSGPRSSAPAEASLDVKQLRIAVGAGRVDDVFAMIQAGKVDLTASGVRDIVAPALGEVTLDSTPPGAETSLARLVMTTPDAPLQFDLLGRTPLIDHPLVAGQLRGRLRSGSLPPAEAPLRVKAGDRIKRIFSLATAGTPEGFVLVPAGPVPVQAGARLDAFAIGRREVTNAEFLKFVSADGYRTARFWPPTIELDGQDPGVGRGRFEVRRSYRAARSAVLGRGTYPEGKAEHPVVGVNWYEAAAYARFADLELPAWNEWWRAALGDAASAFPWGDDVNTAETRANFGLIGTSPVGTRPAGMSPFGCYDMAGNVREWLRDAITGTARRHVVGGSWQDPAYMFEPAHAELFDPAFASESIGFRLVRRATATR